jgi:hypothetical protein
VTALDEEIALIEVEIDSSVDRQVEGTRVCDFWSLGVDGRSEDSLHLEFNLDLFDGEAKEVVEAIGAASSQQQWRKLLKRVNLENLVFFYKVNDKLLIVDGEEMFQEVKMIFLYR